MKTFLLPLSYITLLIIKIYQLTKRRKYSKCLHHPSCSNYAIIALNRYNFIKALKLIKRRYNDCNPFSNRSYVDYP